LGKFLLTAKFIKEYLSLSINIPIFPGPDLACRASIPWAPLRKPYSDRKVFHATRARAGHHSMFGAKRSGLKN